VIGKNNEIIYKKATVYHSIGILILQVYSYSATGLDFVDKEIFQRNKNKKH
jgi:hypothetical protein